MDNVEWMMNNGLTSSGKLKAWCFGTHCILFIIYCSFLAAQTTPSAVALTGTWIGVHSEWDTDMVCPLPTYLQLDADSTYHLGMVDGSAAELVSTWSVGGKGVRLDTIHYSPGLVQVNNDLLRIGTFYPMVFRRFTDVPLDSARVMQQLTGRVWQSDSAIISLFANGRVSIENCLTNQRSAHFWRLARFRNSVFLVITGNQHNREGGYKPLWQISSLSPKQMQVIGWQGRAVTTETFRFIRNLTPGDSCRPSGFQPCDNCFARMWHLTNLTNSEARYDVKRLVGQYYQAIEQPGQSGLIRVEFVVNCAGERGLFQLTGLDENYRPKEFNARISQQLLAICRDHIPAELANFVTDQPGNTPHDSAISITFRLKDGHLVDILP